MKIVALWGKEKTGKTTTLKMFLQELLEKNNLTATDINSKEITSGYLKDELKRENSTLSDSAKTNDYAVKFKMGGKQYGLTTHGDNGGVLKNAFDNFTDCDVVFCAARTSGSSVKFLKGQNAELIWVAKTYITDNRTPQVKPLDAINYTNKVQVDILFEILEKYI